MSSITKLSLACLVGFGLSACATQPSIYSDGLIPCRPKPFSNGPHSRAYNVSERDVKTFSGFSEYRVSVGQGWAGGEAKDICFDVLPPLADQTDNVKGLVAGSLATVGAIESKDANVAITVSWLVHDVPGANNYGICLITPEIRVGFPDAVELEWNGNSVVRSVDVYVASMEWFAPKECVVDQLADYTNLQVETIRKSIAGDLGPVTDWRPQ